MKESRHGTTGHGRGRRSRKGLLMMALLSLCFLVLPVRAEAAKLDKTSVILLKGKTATVSLKKYPKKTKKFAWKKSGKAVKIIRKKKNTAKIKAVKCGTSVVKIKSGKKTLKCKVTVIKNNAEIKLAKGSGSVLELGKKVVEATSSNPKAVKVAKKGTAVKLTAAGSGTAKVMVITAGGAVTRLEITVPGKTGDKPTADEPGTPGTEPVVEKPETPGTEPVVTDPETPGSETEAPGAGVASITDRPRFYIGCYYYCKSDQHDYANFYSRFLAPALSTEEANAWIDALDEEQETAVEENINASNYSDEYKAKLLAVLHREVEYDDAKKAELRDEFFDEFEAHVDVCETSTSSDRNVYVYGEWTQIPEDEYEEWRKENIK